MAERNGDEATVAPAGGISAIEFERFAHQLGGESMVAALMLQYAEVMQRSGVRWIECEGFAVKRLGGIEAACLVRFERSLDQRGEVSGGRRGGGVGLMFHEGPA